MHYSKQTGWHTADDGTLNTTIRDLRLDLDLQKMTGWRPKTELKKESEYWTYIHQVDRNTTPNE